MAYIKPTSEVYLLEGVPLSPESEDTILWATNLSKGEGDYSKVVASFDFDNTAQYEYFYDKRLSYYDAKNVRQYYGNAKYSDITFQRRNSGVVRVNLNASYLDNVNYLMFRNPRSYSSTAYSDNTYNAGGATDGTGYNKWYYAFVTQVDYVNENCSDVHYMIDNLQTFQGEIIKSLVATMIDRQTVRYDAPGNHIEPESVEGGEYVFNDFQDLGANIEFEPIGSTTTVTKNLKSGAIMVANTYVTDEDGVEGHIYDGVYGAAQLRAYDTSQSGWRAQLHEYLETFATDHTANINLYMAPLIPCIMANGGEGSVAGEIPAGGKNLDETAQGELHVNVKFPAGRIQNSTTIDGYTPTNKKLYTYPFNCFHVTNANGGSLLLRYEFFDDTTVTGSDGTEQTVKWTPQFRIDFAITQPVTTTIHPVNYKGSGDGKRNPDEKLDIVSYPMCSWGADSYNQWLAQNAGNIFATIIKGGMQAFSTASIANAKTGLSLAGDFSKLDSMLGTHTGSDLARASVGELATPVGDVLGLMAQGYAASLQPDIVTGTANNGGGNMASGMDTFYGGQVCISSTYAKMIDDFFTKYGYHVMRVDKPMLHTGRAHFDYVKTLGICVAPTSANYGIPATALNDINRRFNNGIRWWHGAANMFDYSGNEAPYNGLVTTS